MTDVPYTDEEVAAAIHALEEPGRLDAALHTAGASAPALQTILNQSLEDADWFGATHQEEVRKAVTHADVEERDRAVRTLLAEETRVVMMLGVAVGLELAHELEEQRQKD